MGLQAVKILRSGLIGLIFFATLSGCATTKQADHANKKHITTAKLNIGLALMDLEKNNPRAAQEKILLAQQEAPSLPETWYATGYYYEMTGESNKAEAYYLKAINMAPARGDVQNNYGTFLCRAGFYQRSIEHFDLAVADPKYIDVADADENAGFCAEKIPDKVKAMKYFHAAVLKDPNRASSILQLAELNYQAGDMAAAEHWLDRFSHVSSPTKASEALKANLFINNDLTPKISLAMPTTLIR